MPNSIANSRFSLASEQALLRPSTIGAQQLSNGGVVRTHNTTNATAASSTGFRVCFGQPVLAWCQIGLSILTCLHVGSSQVNPRKAQYNYDVVVNCVCAQD